MPRAVYQPLNINFYFMSSATHPLFQKPEDLDTPIWRYMDFTKFVAMLESGALYFSRTDLLGDPFEGSITKPNLKKREALRALSRPEIRMGRQLERLGPVLGPKFLRNWTFINCWHMNYHESFAMWSLYAKTNEAIAIKTTFRKMDELLGDQNYFGVVKYIDFATEEFDESNQFNAVLHKRISFAHEKEVRAVVFKPPTSLQEGHQHYDPQTPIVAGHLQPVDFNSLLSDIYVAPTSADWFHKLVQAVSTQYKLLTPVHKSSLDTVPDFY